MIPIAAVDEHLPRLPADLPDHLDLDLLPAGPGRDPAAARPERRALTANSAMWAGETFADIIGYPLAGIFVAFLGSALPLAFWLDAATYAASAILIASIVGPGGPQRDRRPTARPAAADCRPPSVLAEMREGFRFLRREPVLFANTIQAAFAQFALGCADRADADLRPRRPRAAERRPEGRLRLPRDRDRGRQPRSVGSRSASIGMRLAKGRLVIAGYVLWGAASILFALSGNVVARLRDPVRARASRTWSS